MKPLHDSQDMHQDSDNPYSPPLTTDTPAPAQPAERRLIRWRLIPAFLLFLVGTSIVLFGVVGAVATTIEASQMLERGFDLSYDRRFIAESAILTFVLFATGSALLASAWKTWTKQYRKGLLWFAFGALMFLTAIVIGNVVDA
jgi:hypothetical protein